MIINFGDCDCHPHNVDLRLLVGIQILDMFLGWHYPPIRILIELVNSVILSCQYGQYPYWEWIHLFEGKDFLFHIYHTRFSYPHHLHFNWILPLKNTFEIQVVVLILSNVLSYSNSLFRQLHPVYSKVICQSPRLCSMFHYSSLWNLYQI